ncbi:hypothetical protein [Fluviicola sp.]|uniref:hypothetical protein n=1 Tax=Fluviicola sp. TaxID=1917219 RepID=UPI0031DAEE62
MKYFITILFLAPLTLLGQFEEDSVIEKFVERHIYFDKTKQYDSLFLNGQNFLKYNRRAAKEHHMDYYMIEAAFKMKDYTFALKQSRKFIPDLYLVIRRTRETFDKNIRYQWICFKLADYYDQTGNYRKEYHNLSLINRKFNYLYCGNGRIGWQNNLYNRMIECSDKQGKTQRVKRLKKKQEAFKQRA